MLRKRLIAAALMIGPMATLIWLDVRHNAGHPGVWLVPTALVISLVIAGELLAMLRTATPGAIAWVVYVGCALFHLAAVAPHLPGVSAAPLALHGWAVLLTFVFAIAHEMWAYHKQRDAVMRVALTLFATYYAGALLAFLDTTRLALENETGALAIFSILFVIKVSDAGAYFAGKRFGRLKLAPLLSPKKTVEGLVGGLAAAVLGALVVLQWAAPRWMGYDAPSAFATMAYGASLALCGVFGDLAESLLKRNMGCKDSSGWLPGLGGILDTTDSVLLTAPLAYVWWISGLL